MRGRTSSMPSDFDHAMPTKLAMETFSISERTVQVWRARVRAGALLAAANNEIHHIVDGPQAWRMRDNWLRRRW